MYYNLRFAHMSPNLVKYRISICKSRINSPKRQKPKEHNMIIAQHTNEFRFEVFIFRTSKYTKATIPLNIVPKNA